MNQQSLKNCFSDKLDSKILFFIELTQKTFFRSPPVSGLEFQIFICCLKLYKKYLSTVKISDQLLKNWKFQTGSKLKPKNVPLNRPWKYFDTCTPLKSKLTNPAYTLKISDQYLNYLALQLGSKFVQSSTFCPLEHVCIRILKK